MLSTPLLSSKFANAASRSLAAAIWRCSSATCRSAALSAFLEEGTGGLRARLADDFVGAMACMPLTISSCGGGTRGDPAPRSSTDNLPL